MKGHEALGQAESLLPAHREAAIKAFEGAEAGDATNPFLPVYRGLLLAAAGRADDAARAFDTAASLEAATWQDLLRVSPMLEDADARAAAHKAFARGRDGMKANGVRGEAITALMSAMVLAPPPRDALMRAIAAGDAERLHEVASRFATMFPRVEGLDQSAAAVATWMRARGRTDLAATWSGYAAGVDSVYQRKPMVADLDRMKSFLVATYYASLVVALTAGARSGARRRVQAVDAIALLIPLGVAFGVLFAMAGAVKTVNTVASIPQPMLADAVASPDVERWLARQPASPARDRLMGHVRREAEAARDGRRADQPPLDEAALLEVVRSFPLTERLHLAVMEFERPTPGSVVLFGVPFWLLTPFSYLPVFVIHALVLFGVMWLVARWKPAIDRAAWLMPGSPAALGVFGGIVLVALLGSLDTVLGGDWALRSMTPSYGFFSVTMPAEVVGTPPWAWVVLVVTVAVHAWATWRARPRKTTGRTSNSAS